MLHSQTAIRFSIDNWPTAEEIVEMKNLAVNVLQPIRDKIGVPIRISSGYRSVALNKRIGGSNNSQHTRGQAADIIASGMTPHQLAKKIIELNITFDQLIWEGDWVHISFNARGNKRQVLTAHFNNGRVTYTPGIPEKE
jgi:hypothetical protein